MLKSEIGLRIKEIRENLNMTKECLAKMLGISGQYLGMVERGKGSLSVEKLKILCADYILFGKDYTLPNNMKKILEKYTDKQLNYGCKALEELASFLKYVD